jgi:alpha-1,2-mannosyltransferase
MLRALVTTWLGVTAFLFAFVAGRGLTGSLLLAVPFGAVVGGLFAFWLYRGPSRSFDPTACPRSLQIVSAIAAVLALVLLGRLALFMIDPSRVDDSFCPSSQWEVQHSCLTAYHVAAAAVGQANVYDASLYTLPEDDPTQPRRKARMLGAFRVDVYEYPPQFLLLPGTIRLVAPEFLDERMVWFGLNGGSLLLAIVIVASLLGPIPGPRALLLSSLVWTAVPTLSALQKGNVQVLVIAMSMLAMVLFERRRWAAGAALLAFATVSKLYPGLLIVYLLVRRQWRAVFWTGVFGLAFSLATLVLFGWAPYASFLEHLPGLLSGEAFPAFRNPAAVAINLSIPGLVFKLKLFGVPGMSFGTAKIVGWVYTLLGLATIVVLGTRAIPEREASLVWLAILILATLRSPFLPQAYGAVPPIWLLTLVAACAVPNVRVALCTLLTWLALSIYWPTDWPADPRVISLAIALTQAATFLLVFLVMRRMRESRPAEGYVG